MDEVGSVILAENEIAGAKTKDGFPQAS